MALGLIHLDVFGNMAWIAVRYQVVEVEVHDHVGSGESALGLEAVLDSLDGDLGGFSKLGDGYDMVDLTDYGEFGGEVAMYFFPAVGLHVLVELYRLSASSTQPLVPEPDKVAGPRPR